MTSLVARSVGVELGGKQIIRDVSVQFEGGRIVGLIGPNGAGKSTLIRALTRLLETSEGDVLLDGKAITSYRRKDLAKLIGYLPQGHEMHWPLEVEQLIALGRLPHRSPFSTIGDVDQRAVGCAMDRADVREFRTRTADTLSGGERARVMLARALASEPPILFADEPVASLDPYHQLQVMELLQSLARENMLVVCVLHDLSLAARFCDELVLMESGRVVCCGKPMDVLDREHLKTAYRVNGIYGSTDGEDYVLPWRRLDGKDEIVHPETIARNAEVC